MATCPQVAFIVVRWLYDFMNHIRQQIMSNVSNEGVLFFYVSIRKEISNAWRIPEYVTDEFLVTCSHWGGARSDHDSQEHSGFSL